VFKSGIKLGQLADSPQFGIDTPVLFLVQVLRKYSVVPVVTRTLTCDDELMGHTIPKGTMVACHIQVSGI
jgi:cytochrome P450